MFSVRPVKKDDFDKVYPLLQQIPSAVPITSGTWQNLFDRQWSCQVEPLGYVLLRENEIVGYISLITTKREINGRKQEIADLTSWTVDKHCGGHAMQMLFPFIQDQTKTLRCFTPAKSVNTIFRRFGFQELNAFMQVIPFFSLPFGGCGPAILFDVDENLNLLNPVDRQIYDDHRKFSGEQFILKGSNGKHCFVVAKRIYKKKIPFLHVHYASDKQLFTEEIGKSAAAACAHFKTFGLIVFDHCLGNRKVPGAIRLEMQSKPLYRSQTLKSEDIDSLYSEYFVLNF